MTICRALKPRASSPRHDPPGVPLDPPLELRRRDQNKPAGENTFSSGCTFRSKWFRLIPSDAAASARVNAYRGTDCIGRGVARGIQPSTPLLASTSSRSFTRRTTALRHRLTPPSPPLHPPAASPCWGPRFAPILPFCRPPASPPTSPRSRAQTTAKEPHPAPTASPVAKDVRRADAGRRQIWLWARDRVDTTV